MTTRPIVFIDVETTGLSARDGQVIEIGAIRVENGQIVGSLNQLIDPGVDLPYFITRITGIIGDDLRGRPSFREVLPRLSDLLSGAIFAAHNVDFDHGFLSQEYRRAGDSLRVDRFCTARLSRMLNPEHRRHSLDAVIERGGYEVKKRHRAYDDALVLWQFYQDALKQHGNKVPLIINKIMTISTQRPQKLDPRYIPFIE